MTLWSGQPIPGGGYIGPLFGENQYKSTSGSVDRSLSVRADDEINVKDFGAIGDNIADDQTEVAAAVAAAYAAGKTVFWPAGTYITTATIPNFHDVSHRGEGILKRSSTLFYVDPSMHTGVTNDLYMATTGSDTNDGLTSSQPRLTVLSTGNLVYRYRWSNCIWRINIAAGTYTTAGNNFSSAFPSSERVQFLGASVSAGVQPTTIIQATGHGVGTSVIGFYFQNSVRTQVSNINFKNYRTNASPSAILLSSGIVADSRSEIYTVNVWTDDCDQGIYITNGSHARIQAGRHGFNAINGAGVQFIRHAHGTVGYNGSAADINGATGTAFIGGSHGVMIQEFSMAHTDYCYYSAQTLSGNIITLSRIHSVSSTYNTCLVGIDGRLNSNIGITSATFTACTNDFLSRSGSVISTTTVNESLMLGPAKKEISTIGGSTQSATPVNLLTRTFVAKELQFRGSGFKLTLNGDVTGTADTKTIVVALAGTTILTATIAAATLEWIIEVELMQHTGTTTQQIATRIFQGGVTPAINCGTIAVDMDAANRDLTVTQQVTNVADTCRTRFWSLEITH